MNKLTIFTAATILAAAASSLTGCDDKNSPAGSPLGDIASQCGFGTCNANGVVDGNLTLTGVANVDAFFSQVANFKATASLVADGLYGAASPIARINAQLGLAPTASAAEVKAQMAAQLGVTGDIKIAYAPPSCEVSAKASVEATAKCDASVSAGSVKATCSGRCEADVQVSGGKVSCSGGATAKCTTTAANVACSGSCKGECKLDVAAECTGSCSGTCSGTCDGSCDGKAQSGAAAASCSGKCEGKCTGGTCQGTCKMSGGGTCAAKCNGECSVEAPSAGCSADAKVECFAEPATASGSVQCEGKCEGTVEPPQASVECQASAKAEASLKAECKPPSIEVTAALSATADAAAQAQYKAFMKVFTTEMGSLVANLQRSDVVLKAGTELVGSVGSVTSAFATAAANVGASGNLKAAFGLSCAGQMITAVPGVINESIRGVGTSASMAGTFVAAFK